MKNSTFTSPRRLRLGAALAVAVLALAACGSDETTVEVPEGGTGDPYTQAIIESDSHDEIIFATGGDMVVAVTCEVQTGGTVVTVVGEGLDVGTYIGTFEPSTGVDLTLDVTQVGQTVGASQMTLDADEYTVTFADIEGGEFTIRGCPS